MKKRIIEGVWTCSYCGTNNILGRYQECPNCGRKRSKDFNPRLPSNIEANYVPEEKARNISRNPDWFCNYCDTYNPDNVSYCTSCGAPRDKSNLNYFQIHQQKESEESKEENNEEHFFNNSNFKKYSNIELKNVKKAKASFFTSPIFITSLISILSVILIAFIVYLFTPKEVSMKVTQTSWTRTISIEKLQTIQESDWDLPIGAHLLYTNEEIHHYDSIIDHYETKYREVQKERIIGYDEKSTIIDLGNGYFEEEIEEVPIYETYTEEEEYEEPVYKNIPIMQTKYYYEIDKWVYERSVKTSGTDKSPYWGEVSLGYNEREDSKSETLQVTGIVKGKSTTITLSSDDWNKVEIGETIKLKISFGFGKLIE